MSVSITKLILTQPFFFEFSEKSREDFENSLHTVLEIFQNVLTDTLNKVTLSIHGTCCSIITSIELKIKLSA